MADLSKKKLRFIQEGVRLATELQDILQQVAELDAEYFANAFNDGAGNALVNADFVEPVEYLTASDFVSLVTALQAIKTTYEANGNNTAIRKAAYGGD
jgi:hypothetical protein